MNSSNKLLLESLNNFYNKYPKYKILLNDIINGKHLLSLRIIYWLITHYSKHNNIFYWIDNDNIYFDFPTECNNIKELKKIDLYLDYRAQLDSYTIANFDSFRRHDRVSFIIDNEKNIYTETTIGQLNFFRWAFTNKVIEYSIIHYNNIKEDMIKNLSKKTTNKIKQNIINTKCFVVFD